LIKCPIAASLDTGLLLFPFSGVVAVMAAGEEDAAAGVDKGVVVVVVVGVANDFPGSADADLGVLPGRVDLGLDEFPVLDGTRLRPAAPPVPCRPMAMRAASADPPPAPP